jgi:CRISPR/Cas system-associated exonuclease Cas4 (RecB family)/rubrerythrin
MPRTRPKPRRRNQPVKEGLRGFVDAKKTHVDLIKDVQTHVVAQGVKNNNVGRESHKIHVSELVKDTSCPRHMYYKISKTEPSDVSGGAYHRLEMIWAAGHDAHHKWQRWLKEMGDLWGSWLCLQCTHAWDDLAPEACPECGGVLLEYKEVNLEDPVYPLVGHADGAVPRLDALIEVKSFAVGTVRVENSKLVSEHTHKIDGRAVIDHEGLWKDIKRPLKGHLVQGLMYLWMADRMGLPYHKIIFIYENKTTQATKTFEVSYSERFVRVYFDILDEVMAAVEDGVPPPRPALFAPDGKPCKDCVFRTDCWSESDDAGSQAPAVPPGGSVSGGEEAGGEAAVRPSRPSRSSDPGRPRRRHGPGRPRTDEPHDRDDPVGRAPRDSVGARRGGRAVGGSSDGEGESPRFARRRR